MMEIWKGETYKREEKKMKRMLRTEEKPKMEVKEEKIKIPGTEEEITVKEEDLYDPEIFSKQDEFKADLGDDKAEDVNPSGTSSEQPRYQKG